MSYLGFSTKWAAKLAQVHHLNNEKQIELTYAIEVVTLNSINVVFTLLIGWAFGVFAETVSALLTVAALRHTAGGGHSESPWRCAVVTIIVFPLLGLAASCSGSLPSSSTGFIYLVALLVCFACILRYAPVDNAKAPIISAVRRKRFKAAAMVVVAVVSALVVILEFYGDNTDSINMALVLGTLWASFNMTPLGHRLWCFIDMLGLKKKGGV
jgi:accessory gene regulator B